MRNSLLFPALCAALCCCQGPKEAAEDASLNMIAPVDFSHVKIADPFWSPRLDKHSSATLPVCIDQIENQTGRIRNFENAARGEGTHSGILIRMSWLMNHWKMSAEITPTTMARNRPL